MSSHLVFTFHWLVSIPDMKIEFTAIEIKTYSFTYDIYDDDNIGRKDDDMEEVLIKYFLLWI